MKRSVCCEGVGCDTGPVVVAAVVSFNRRKLLDRCVAHLRAQSAPLAAIVVVDNGSSDGTREWLGEQHDLRVYLQANVGSAGGLTRAIGEAMSLGADFIWCMDDDGYPRSDALAELLAVAARERADWLNSVVVSEDDPCRLAFGLVSISDGVFEESRFPDLIEGEANPFNGTLLSRRLVEQIGLPASELFLWGDETEYLRRAIRAGVRVLTVRRSVFLHPLSRTIGSLAKVPLDQMWRHYLRIRNHGAVWDGERVKLSGAASWQLARILLSMLRSDWGCDRWRSNVKRVLIALRAVQAAFLDDFSHPVWVGFPASAVVLRATPHRRPGLGACEPGSPCERKAD